MRSCPWLHARRPLPMSAAGSVREVPSANGPDAASSTTARSTRRAPVARASSWAICSAVSDSGE